MKRKENYLNDSETVYIFTTMSLSVIHVFRHIKRWIKKKISREKKDKKKYETLLLIVFDINGLI